MSVGIVDEARAEVRRSGACRGDLEISPGDPDGTGLASCSNNNPEPHADDGEDGNDAARRENLHCEAILAKAWAPTAGTFDGYFDLSHPSPILLPGVISELLSILSLAMFIWMLIGVIKFGPWAMKKPGA